MNNLEIGLYIVSTPIGNLKDLTLRAKLILESVDIIICENPNHSLKLLNNLGIKKKLLSLHDYNEIALIKRIEKYQLNSSIALISDAGSPLISDPGYNLVRDYIDKNLMITSVPGASSIIPALQLSGLPIHNFIFYGFIPKNIGGMKDLIKKISEASFTGVMFISGSRLLSFLELLSKNDDFKISVCKEITKKNEAVYRGSPKKIAEIISKDLKKLKGEFVIIAAKVKSKDNNKINNHINKQMEKLLKKFSLTEVVEIVHKLTNISKKEIYGAALLIKDD